MKPTIKITGVTIHPQTAAARAAVAPLIKHLTSLTSQQLLVLAARAKGTVRTVSNCICRPVGRVHDVFCPASRDPHAYPLRKVVRSVPDTDGKRLYVSLSCFHVIELPIASKNKRLRISAMRCRECTQ